MYFTVYKITNLINGKIYIGVHQTKNLDDGYMGSGKCIKRAIEKYGVSNFHKEYLEIFDNQEDMFNMESKIVNEDFILDNKNYNLKLGGFGGYGDHMNERLKTLLQEDSFRKTFSEKISRGLKKKYNDDLEFKNRKKQFFVDNPSFKGMKHSKETREKMSKSSKGLGSGENNSQFGTMWITDGCVSKKIKKADVIPEGWYPGRVIKGK